MAEPRPVLRHPACPVCTGPGGWDASGAPTRPQPYVNRTKCLYCGGSGRCQPCEANGGVHPTPMEGRP